MKTYEVNVGGKDYKIDIERFDGKQAVIKVDGKPYQVDVKKAAGAVFPGQPASPTPPPPSAPTASPSAPVPPSAPVAMAAPSGGQILAPMPGLVLDVMVSVGDAVTVGTPVVKIEAMKMENEIPAPVNGTVKELRVKKGDRVATEEVLLLIDEG